MNKPENIKSTDGEFIYVVKHYNYKGNMVMTYHIKESELVIQ